MTNGDLPHQSVMVDCKRNASAKGTRPSKIIAALNSLNVGALDVIRARLDDARRACLEIDETELAERLDDAARALDRADMKTYRKRVESVVSRLGHLR